jgi:hypothetical protein
MRYVKHQTDLNWVLVTPESEDDEYLQYHGIFKLVEHEEPHESWDPTRWRAIEHLELQSKMRILHRFYRIVPIDAYEPDRSTIIELAENNT